MYHEIGFFKLRFYFIDLGINNIYYTTRILLDFMKQNSNWNIAAHLTKFSKIIRHENFTRIKYNFVTPQQIHTAHGSDRYLGSDEIKHLFKGLRLYNRYWVKAEQLWKVLTK